MRHCERGACSLRSESSNDDEDSDDEEDDVVRQQQRVNSLSFVLSFMTKMKILTVLAFVTFTVLALKVT